MPLPATERVALRNSAVVLLGFSVIRLLRQVRSSKRPRPAASSKSAGEYDEMLRCALAAGLTGELYGRGLQLSGSPAAAALLSGLPLRTLCRDRSYHFSYDFIAAYVSAQTLVAAIPAARNYPAVSMAVSASQLLSAWILHDDRLPEDYRRFLHSQGKASRQLLEKVRYIYSSGSGQLQDMLPLIFNTKDGRALTAQHGTDWVGIHLAAAHWFALHFREALPFYGKIYTMRAAARLLAKGRGITKEIARMMTVSPEPQLRGGLSFCSDVARSAFFLSLYCTLAWYSIGVSGKLFPETTATPGILQLTCLVPGLAIAVESKSQQHTISNYCSTFALYPLLAQNPYFFDAALSLAGVACASGAVRTPPLLGLLWPPAPAPAKSAPVAASR